MYNVLYWLWRFFKYFHKFFNYLGHKCWVIYDDIGFKLMAIEHKNNKGGDNNGEA